MISNIQNRLLELQSEYERGQETLSRLQAQESQLQDELLRIAGAIQVLNELLAQDSDKPVDGEF